MIYLDYSADTPQSAGALDAYLQTARNFPGNPNAAYPLGRAAAAALSAMTAQAGRTLGVPPETLIFVSGASEANNTAVKGVTRALRSRGRHILTTLLEHPSVSAPLTFLQEQGWEVETVRVGRDGKVDLTDLEDLLRDDTVLVTIPAVDSELGVVQPLEDIRALLQTYPNCKLHVDMTQAIGKCPVDLTAADCAALSAHKFYGPGGVGLLYKKSNLAPEPLIHGGAGQSVYRSGTPCLPLAASCVYALEEAERERETRFTAVRRLNGRLRAALSAFSDVRINSPAGAIPHILNFSLTGVKGLDLQRALGEKEVCISVKSACSVPGTPSKSVLAVTGDRKNALSSVRVSLSHLTTERELDAFLERFEICRKELKP